MSTIVTNLLSNSSNYLEKYNHDDITIINKFNNLLKDYLIQLEDSLKNINILDDKKKYIIIVGLSTITNVFRIILIYTKNLDISYQISKKSIYYYLEFIGQICEDQHEFLKLTPKDASLFVYKKTIDTINKNINNNKINLEITLENILESNYNIVSKLIIYILNNNNNNIKSDIFNKIKQIISIYNSDILQLKKYNINDFQNKLEIIELCTDNLDIDNNTTITISFIIGIIKKLIKNNINININKVQIGLLKIKNILHLTSERKLINLFFEICTL